MPLMPEFENDIALRPVPSPQADPAALAAPFAAIAQGGAEVSDAAKEWVRRYGEARRASAASNITVGLGKQLSDLEHKYSLIPDRTEALAGYNTDVAALQKSSVDTIADPLIRSHVVQQFGSEALARGDAVGRQSFALESSKHRGELEQNLLDLSTAAAQAPNEHARAIVTDNAKAAIAGAVAGGWINPEEATAHGIKWASDTQAVRARDDMNAAIDSQNSTAMYKLAQNLSNPANYPGMLQEQREMLRTHVENAAYRLQMREAQREAHADAMAERAMHQAQAHNEAVLLAHANAGEPLSDVQIEQLADHGQISAGGVEALHTAKDRAIEGHDDPLTVAHLFDRAAQGDDVREDTYTAFKAGAVGKTSLYDLVKTVDAKNAKGESGLDKGNFDVLKKAMNGGAIESGSFLGIGGDRAQASARYAQALGEWNRRVVAGSEDSNAVLSDMVPRYAPALTKPTWLPPTKFGPVNSTRDVMARAQQLAGAVRSKQISQSDFEAQGALLTDYRNFYRLEDERAAAAARAKRKPTTGIEPGAGE